MCRFIPLFLFSVFFVWGAGTFLHADTVDVSVEVQEFACNDGVDNDIDGLIDYPNDPGCDSASDDDETDEPGIPGGGGAFLDDEDGVEEGGVSMSEIPIVAEIVTFTGLAPANSEVTLLVDGTVATTTRVGDGGSFFVERVDMTPGTYLFTLYATDVTGTRSGLLSFSTEIVASAFTDISDIFIPPTLHVPRIPLGAGQAPIAGYAVPGSEVELVFEGGGIEERARVIAGPDGRYEYTLLSGALPTARYISKSLARTQNLASPFGRALQFSVSSIGIRIFSESTTIPGDFNDDGRVNLVDFSMIAFWYEQDDAPRRFDLNRDGVVNLGDVSIMAFYWSG